MERIEDPLFSLMSGYLKGIFIPPQFQDMGPSCLRSRHLCVLWDSDFKSVTRSQPLRERFEITRTCWALGFNWVMFTNIYCNFN